MAARRGWSTDRQGLLAAKCAVEDATVGDLDADLLEAFVASIRRSDPDGRGRFRDRDGLLRSSGVLHPDGRPTVAGVLALGIYPQQWFPRFVIQAAAEPLPGAPSGTRARNQVTIERFSCRGPAGPTTHHASILEPSE